MSKQSETCAVCRSCGRALNGKPYHMGGNAYHPDTGKRCPANYYGGYVCSRQCDYNASLELEESMPGHSGQRSLSGDTLRRIDANWPD